MKDFDSAAFPYLEELEILYCHNVGVLDFSKNEQLKSILVKGNAIKTLNLNGRKNLTSVYIDHTSLKKINLDKCVKLENLSLTNSYILKQIKLDDLSTLATMLI